MPWVSIRDVRRVLEGCRDRIARAGRPCWRTPWKGENGRVEYPEVALGTPPYAVVAIIDDRAENRQRVIEASAVSAERLKEKGIGVVMNIASAAEGFCPEMDVVGMPMVISSFAFKEGA